MIRPLTNEENLQNLTNMELEDLRADFVEQVLQLRRKVLNRIKPKVINGKKLSGQMLSTLASSYVTSINNGAVPNIENAWNYICKNECNKALDECLHKFDESLKDSLVTKLPLEEEDLKLAYKEAKTDMISMFHKKAVGNIAEDFMKELKFKAK